MEGYELKKNENYVENTTEWEKKNETVGSLNHSPGAEHGGDLDALGGGAFCGDLNHVEQVPGDRSLPDLPTYEGDVWEYYPGIKKRPKLNQDSLVNLVLNLKERVEKLENSTEEKDEFLQKKIAKADMEKMVIDAISNGNMEYGVSKGFVKSFLMNRYKLHWSAHYQKKLSIVLHGLIDKKLIMFDTTNQLFKVAQY